MFVHNNWNKIIHLNKNTIVGDTESIDLKRINSNFVNLDNISSNMKAKSLLILYSHVINLRRTYLNMDKIDLKHLKEHEMKQLSKILNDHFWNFKFFRTRRSSCSPNLKFRYN